MGGFCLLVELHPEGSAIKGATPSSFVGRDHTKLWDIPVSRFTPFSYQFEVKNGIHEQILLYE